MAGRGQIDDREPAMAEGEARGGIDPAAGVVRSAVAKRIRHGVDDGAELLWGRLTPRLKKTADPAHPAVSPQTTARGRLGGIRKPGARRAAEHDALVLRDRALDREEAGASA